MDTPIKLTPQQEEFCKNIVIEEMSQTDAYLKAYPNAKNGKVKTACEAASRLMNDNSKIIARIKQLKTEIEKKTIEKIVWNKEKAFNDLEWLKEMAKKEITEKGELSAPCVSAITKAVAEQNAIYGVGEDKEGSGVLEDILSAVRGIGND